MKEKELERQLKALANKRRLAILVFLSGRQDASVGSTAEHIKLSFKSTSHHLSILTAADLLDRQQTSTTVLYSLSRPLAPITKAVLGIL